MMMILLMVMIFHCCHHIHSDNLDSDYNWWSVLSHKADIRGGDLIYRIRPFRRSISSSSSSFSGRCVSPSGRMGLWKTFTTSASWSWPTFSPWSPCLTLIQGEHHRPSSLFIILIILIINVNIKWSWKSNQGWAWTLGQSSDRGVQWSSSWGNKI